jgi:hypothetical protein
MEDSACDWNIARVCLVTGDPFAAGQGWRPRGKRVLAAVAWLTLATGCQAPLIALVDCDEANGCAAGEVCSSGTCAREQGSDGSGSMAGVDPSAALIDDFEDGNEFVLPRGGRNGRWIIFDDGTGGEQAIELSPNIFPVAEDGSRRLLHTSGGGFTDWGTQLIGQLSFNFVNDEQFPYDAANYAGVRFTYASRDVAVFSVATSATLPVDVNGSCLVGCYAHPGVSLLASNELRTVEVYWDELFQFFGAPASFDPAQAFYLQWGFPSGVVDFWLDDVAFIAQTPDGPSEPEPTPIIVDDFEDHDLLPADTRFGRWQVDEGANLDHRPAPGESGFYLAVGTSGDASAGAVELEWNMPTGDYPSDLWSSPVAGYIDLTRYRRLSFNHRYEHTGECAPSAAFTVVLDCGAEVRSSFTARIPVSSTWLASELRLPADHASRFPPAAGISAADCLRLTRRIAFGFDPTPADAACGSGHIYVDDIAIH